MFRWFQPKTPHERLIEFLEKRGLKNEADSLRKGNTTLNLSFNQIGAEGAKLIADSLKSNSTLKTLYLGDNQIEDESLKTINEYLQRNKKNAEKKYEEQQQSLKLKQEASVTNENKTVDIKQKIEAPPKDNLANKAATEKKQEKQQQSLKLDELKYNQLISAIRDTKAAEAEKLVKELNSDTVSKINNNGETALTYAARKGLGEVCVQLISRMPDQAINHITNGGDTALTLAVWNGLEKASELLLIPRMTIQAIHYVNNKGETVLSLVIKNNFKKKYDLLTLRIDELNNQFNKTNIYRNEEEPQTLKSKPLTKTTEIIIEEEEDIYQIIGKIIFDLQDSNIDEADKPIIENSLYRIVNKIQKLTDKNDIINITRSIKVLIGNEITEGTVIDLEDEVNEMAEKQTQKKLNIFNETVKKIITKLETANIKDSAVIQTQINEMSSKVQTLENNVSIEQITNWMGKLIDGKITKGTVVDLRKKIETIILQEINESTSVITFAVKEIIYYKPLLNNQKLLQTALDNKLSPDLIYDAITNNDEKLILAGLMSMGYDVAKYI